MKPLISVIIPVYGVEKYLTRAVDSVLGQTYTNLDIILVDDGSKDNCPAICDAYASREARVRVIHKENGGLSDARNAGLAVAGGDYIAFLDSDDYYAPFFIEVLYEQLCSEHADVAMCRYEVTEGLRAVDGPDFASQMERYRRGNVETQTFSRSALLLNQYDALCEDATYFIVAWNKLYKASLWKHIRFPKGKIHEDEATIYRILDQAEKGVYVKMPMYAYFSAPGSITRGAFSLNRLEWFDALDDRISFFLGKEEYDCAKAALRARADGAIKYYYPLRKAFPKQKDAAVRLRGYVREALHTDRCGEPDRCGFLSLRTRMGYRLFLLFPRIYGVLTQRNQ